MSNSQSLEKVCIIGSGNWGTAVAKIVGNNVTRFPHIDSKVMMWVFEEQVDGTPLTEVINTRHENTKYLPGIQLPANVVAEPNLLKAARDATLLIFVLPHQFIRHTCVELRGHIRPNAKAISLVKGLDTHDGGLDLVSNVIADELSKPSGSSSTNGNGRTDRLDVSILSGANIANEIAQEKFSETTIGYRIEQNGRLFHDLFNTSYFRVNIVNDPSGVELCGALKNVVALGAGFVDGLDLGDNTKAAIIRIGLMEMMRIAQYVDPSVRDATFFESCGIADVITTCYGGRNRRIAEAFVRTGLPFDDLEKEMLNGQKLQGTSTCLKVCQFLRERQLSQEFPLFTTIYNICFQGLPPDHITQFPLPHLSKM
ncbi:glycerol-3-phosphate dehydrogenase [Dimargaris cristalligena]|nr:glycerol-3-phosphate dehydrogenase [Dimargaris cristalligena]